mmetsp:Transcript_94244/g.272321  ORF Transcript_94244/g.272321 Transcript_94244/m.272321 type:complete len:377 (-) Transcript_94244:569-1699(-)
MGPTRTPAVLVGGLVEVCAETIVKHHRQCGPDRGDPADAEHAHAHIMGHLVPVPDRVAVRHAQLHRLHNQVRRAQPDDLVLRFVGHLVPHVHGICLQVRPCFWHSILCECHKAPQSHRRHVDLRWALVPCGSAIRVVRQVRTQVLLETQTLAPLASQHQELVHAGSLDCRVRLHVRPIELIDKNPDLLGPFVLRLLVSRCHKLSESPRCLVGLWVRQQSCPVGGVAQPTFVQVARRKGLRAPHQYHSTDLEGHCENELHNQHEDDDQERERFVVLDGAGLHQSHAHTDGGEACHVGHERRPALDPALALLLLLLHGDVLGLATLVAEVGVSVGQVLEASGHLRRYNLEKQVVGGQLAEGHNHPCLVGHHTLVHQSR